MKTIIEPHIHMFSRTTDDYQAMYRSGIRAIVEPSFWLGADRRYAGSFFDYYNLILNFETVRARRFGIDHFCAIAFNPKESENLRLVDEVLDGMDPYLAHKRCVALGEIGFNNITDNEEYAFVRQLGMAKERGLPVLVHLPHFNKPEGIRRSADCIERVGLPKNMVYLDHNIEETIGLALETGYYCGLTVYPISKLTPERVSNIVKEHGAERIIVSGSADWGVSDPLSLVKVIDYLSKDGHDDATIRKLTFENAHKFYSQSANWKPEFDIEPMEIREFQR